MSDKDLWYLKGNEPSLRMWIFQHMTIGALYAAAVFFGAIAVVLVLVAISRLLPEDPFAALEMGRQALSAVA
ncbi:hypothetical protein DXV76_17870 [Rhodobacteraceae bacterium CCMM004]|nr:hypothetical protein DXV76_17870 [Rhodobacteraceae bacterium CCMM004]